VAHAQQPSVKIVGVKIGFTQRWWSLGASARYLRQDERNHPMSAADPFAPEACELCSRHIDRGRPYLLYGHDVCKQCRNSLVLRRELAFLIDGFVVSYGCSLAIKLSMGAVQVAAMKGQPASPLRTWLGTALFCLAFALKDSFGGFSAGKVLTGLRVVDAETGAPIGPRQSVMRNLILLVPLMPIVLAFQMRGGKRLGDGWARTRVIWRKYADRPTFGGVPAAPEPWAS
jgi:uncharacterized RDD family membrane protein YckC